VDIDILIKNGTVYDGTGGKPELADVGILSDKIIFPLKKDEIYNAKHTINADGLAVAPGFINIHSHSDISFLIDPRVPSALLQGITTEVTGNCGTSAAPLAGEELNETRRSLKQEYDFEVTWEDFDGYFSLVESLKPSINVASLVGHGTLRGSCVGMEDRPPTIEEMEKMKQTLSHAMLQGAVGLSTGLIYPPGCYSKKAEIVELAVTAKISGGFYASHIRGEAETLQEAIAEAIAIGRDADIRVQISHLKAAGEKNWGKTKKLLDMIHEARKSALTIQHDQYPYTSSATGLSMVLPEWTFDGGTDAFMSRLKVPEIREKIVREMEPSLKKNGETIWISSVITEKNKIYEGMKTTDAAELAQKPISDFILDLLYEERGMVGAIFLSMSEEDVRRIMKDPFTCIGNDATARAADGPLFSGMPHPRTYGTFPRVLGHYSRDLKLFSTEEAVRKMTSLPAKMINLSGRGEIRDGYYADIVIFNVEKIKDTATYEDPHSYPEGIEYVLVNGGIAAQAGEVMKLRHGRVLRHTFQGGVC